MNQGIRLTAGSLLVVAGATLLISCLEPADEILDKSGETSRIIFVREPSAGQISHNIAMASNTNEFYPGTDLYSLSPIGPTGKLTNLTAQYTRTNDDEDRWGAAADPEVSYDGKRVIFSMRKQGSRHWHIYEMDVSGDNLVQLTEDPPTSNNQNIDEGFDDMDPAYLPDGRIVFTSTRTHQSDEYERRPVSNLFIGTRDGNKIITNFKQLSFNQSHDFNPIVQASTGNIIFSRWDHLGSPNKIGLFTIHADGTRQFVLYGSDETFSGNGMGSGSRTFLEARELRDGGIVSSMMERTSQFEGGAIAVIDLSKPINTAPDIITPSSSPYNTTQKVSDAIYKTPYPIIDGSKERLLVAMSPHEVGGNMDNEVVNYDLFVMDQDGANRKLIFASSETNDYDPVVVESRATPTAQKTDKFVAEGLASNATTGIFFDADVYSRMDNDGHLRPDRKWINHGEDANTASGQAKYVRFLDAISIPSNYNMRGGSLGRTEFEKQRVIGYGPIEKDGSFAIEVPANRSLHLQVLDEDGVMLVNQLQWVHVMPGERRMCTGCHGTREHDKDIQGYTIRESDGAVVDTLHAMKTFMATFAKAVKATEHPAAKTDTMDFYSSGPVQRAIDSTEAVRNKQTWTPKSSYAAYGKTVQGSLDNKCIACHGAATAEDKGAGLILEEVKNDSIYGSGRVSTVYDRLTKENGYLDSKGKRRPYATDNGARQSPLAWVLYNRQLVARKTDEVVYRPTPGYDHTALWEKDSTGFVNVFDAKNKDLLTLIEWMDMGAQFSNSVGKY